MIRKFTEVCAEVDVDFERDVIQETLPEDSATRSGILVYDKGIPLVLGGSIDQDVVLYADASLGTAPRDRSKW